MITRTCYILLNLAKEIKTISLTIDLIGYVGVAMMILAAAKMIHTQSHKLHVFPNVLRLSEEKDISFFN